MTLFRSSKVFLIGACALVSVAGRAAATPAQQPAAPVQQHVAQVADTASHPAGSETEQSRNAARSRMRECGHQWSSMKKNGSAAGMTWKEFSQGCLAKQ